MKFLKHNILIMPPLGSLLVDPCILISIQPQLFELLQLKHSLLTGGFHIIVEQLNCPISFVLQFHREMTRLPINKPEWCSANRSLECRSISPKSIIELHRPILSGSRNCLLQDTLDLSI